MARLIPENLRSRSDVRNAVQDIVRLVEDHFRDDALIQYDVDADDSPLWLLLPDAGVIALYVVDAGRRNIKSRLQEVLGRSVEVPEVVAEAERRAADVSERLSQSRHLSRDVGYTVAVAMTGMRRSDVEQSGEDTAQVLGKEDLTPEAITETLYRVLGGERPRLTEREERAVRAAVDPRIVIRDSHADERSLSGIAFRSPGEDDSPDLAVLDLKQQQLAFHLGDGYRVIRGVAGSGKSLILTARARHLVEQDPSKRVLITCYNVIIAAALSATVEDLPGVDVLNVDAYAWRVLQDSGRRVSQGDDKWEQARQIARDHLRSGRAGSKWKYDAVLVDEGQDFDPLMLDVAFGALRDPEGDFIVVLDGVQNIYRRFGKAWRAGGVTAQGRTTVLDVNYRNTHEILDLAYLLLLAGDANDSSGEGSIQEDEDVVYPQATSRRGPKPRVIAATSVESEVQVACDQLKEWRAGGARWGDMLVLFGDQRKYQGRLFYECQRRDIPYFCATHSRKNRKLIIGAGDVVRSASIMAAKGIEFPYVVVIGVNHLSIGPEAEDTDRRRLAYVAMTRATDKLVVTVSGSGPVGTDLLSVGA
jgi:hypothetical protein